jgi:hypothetical protein
MMNSFPLGVILREFSVFAWIVLGEIGLGNTKIGLPATQSALRIMVKRRRHYVRRGGIIIMDRLMDRSSLALHAYRLGPHHPYIGLTLLKMMVVWDDDFTSPTPFERCDVQHIPRHLAHDYIAKSTKIVIKRCLVDIMLALFAVRRP